MPYRVPSHNPYTNGKKPKAHRRNPSSPIYHTARWERIRQMVLAKNPLCVDPFGTHKEYKEIVPGVDIDHIIPISMDPDLTWVVENLQPLCKSCHSKKTRQENKNDE